MSTSKALDSHPLPANSSLTIRFTRNEKFTVDTTPTQLTQGVAPSAQGLVVNQVEAVAEQYGYLVRISDLAELTSRHNLISSTLNILGLHAAEVYDQLIFTVLDAATNTHRPNSRSADTAILATDLIGYNDLIQLEANIMDTGGRPISGGSYVYVIPPQVKGGLQKDTNWLASNQLRAPEKIWRGEIGTLGNLSVVVSNAPGFAFTSQSTAGFANKLYSGFVIARQAYAVTDLQNLQVYTIAPGGQTDPLYQNRLLSYKFSFKSVILNNNWLWRTRSAGLNSTNN